MRALCSRGVQHPAALEHEREVMRGVSGPQEKHVTRLRRVVRGLEPFSPGPGEPFRHYGRLRPPRRGSGPRRRVDFRDPSSLEKNSVHEPMAAHATAALRRVVHKGSPLPRKGDLLKAGDL